MLIAAKFFGGADRQGVRVFDLVRNPQAVWTSSTPSKWARRSRKWHCVRAKSGLIPC